MSFFDFHVQLESQNQEPEKPHEIRENKETSFVVQTQGVQIAKDVSLQKRLLGGGLAELLTAFVLQEKGVRVTVVEKGRIISGERGKTTAKITYQHGFVYYGIAKRRSIEVAKQYMEANRAAFERYKKLCGRIDCDHETKGNFIYTVGDPAALEEEMTFLQRMGFPARFCSRLTCRSRRRALCGFPPRPNSIR